MKIALLATGDEIVYGDTLNTNSHQLAHALNSEGLKLGLHLSCTDEETEIYDGLQFLAIKHDVIIITGGLGPTSDDRTRFALGRFINEPLIEFPAALEHIKTRLLHSHLALSEGNKQQSLFPADATLLPNPNGTAMGCYCWLNNKLFVLLPGPPRECLPMFNDYVMPIMQTLPHQSTQLLKWRLFGVAEAQIAQQLDEALKNIDCVTGYRLETPYVECKVRFEPHLLDTITAIVEPIIQPHIIASTLQKASEKLATALAEWQKKIVIDDNITGGILQTLIQRPANYPWIKFGDSDNATIKFRIEGLTEFWGQEKQSGTTTLVIHYSDANGGGKESHNLPYRSAMVVHYAAEWLCFRLFHLINQLHE